MDQDGHRGRFSELEDLAHLLAVEAEVLCPGVKLDAPRPSRKAAFALLQRVFGRIQAAEGRQSSVAFAGPCQDAIVGQAVGGLALRVMQGKHACPSCLCVVKLDRKSTRLNSS